MPCNLAARARAAVSNETLSKMVLDNPQIIANMRTLLANIVGMTPNDITLYNDKPGTTWNVGWNEWRRSKKGVTFPAEQLGGANYVDWVCDKCAVRLERNGTITLRDGWDLPTSKHFTPAQAEQMLAQVNAALNQACGLLFQQHVKNTLAQKFAIESVQAAANGAIAITFEV